MAKKIGNRAYKYRQHLLTLNETHWKISGPAVNTEATTIRDAMRLVDEAPAAPAKTDKREAGRLGAKAFYSKYSIHPVGTSDWAITSRETGEVVSFLSGRPW